MAFCPECGKAVTAEATHCRSCGHELNGGKDAGARFKGTMMMAASIPPPASSGELTGGDDAAEAASPADQTAPGSAPTPAGHAPAAKAAAKATMIGTGIAAPAAPRPAAATPRAAAAQPPAVAPAQPQPAAKKAAGATMIGQPGLPAGGNAPLPATGMKAELKQTAPARPAALAAAREREPSASHTLPREQREASARHELPQEREAIAGHAPTQARAVIHTSPKIDHDANSDDPYPAAANPPRARTAPAAVESGAYPSGAETEADDAEAANTDEPRYLPGDPMAPQPAAAPRGPMLRYDDSVPRLPKHDPLADRRWIWIAAGVIMVACLSLVIVLASKMSH